MSATGEPLTIPQGLAALSEIASWGADQMQAAHAADPGMSDADSRAAAREILAQMLRQIDALNMPRAPKRYAKRSIRRNVERALR